MIRVSSPEATALDLLCYSEPIGGYSRAKETILPMAKLFNADRLRATLDADDEPAVGQRLGFTLEDAGHNDLATIISRALDRTCSSRRPGTFSDLISVGRPDELMNLDTKFINR